LCDAYPGTDLHTVVPGCLSTLTVTSIRKAPFVVPWTVTVRLFFEISPSTHSGCGAVRAMLEFRPSAPKQRCTWHKISPTLFRLLLLFLLLLQPMGTNDAPFPRFSACIGVFRKLFGACVGISDTKLEQNRDVIRGADVTIKCTSAKQAKEDETLCLRVDAAQVARCALEGCGLRNEG
jgi:hypothetical protein